MIDATKIVGRVTISGDNRLGVLYPGYNIGQPISVEEGNIQYITLYNGVEFGGPISFRLTFSKATKLVTSAFTASLLAYIMY